MNKSFQKKIIAIIFAVIIVFCISLFSSISDKGNTACAETPIDYAIYRNDGITYVCDANGANSGAAVDRMNVSNLFIAADVVNIPDGLTKNSTVLQNLILENGIKTIGFSSFENCVNLKSVSLPSGLTAIGSYSFAFNPSLSNIIFPETLTTISGNAFSNSGLIEITLPASITTFESACFSDIQSLKKVTLQSKITDLGSWIFSGCTSLEDIIIPDTLKSIDAFTFNGVNNLSITVNAVSDITVTATGFNGTDTKGIPIAAVTGLNGIRIVNESGKSINVIHGDGSQSELKTGNETNIALSSIKVIFHANKINQRLIDYVFNGESIIIPDNKFNLKGFSFICWNTEPQGNGISYNKGDNISFSAETTLYAQWLDVEAPYVEIYSTDNCWYNFTFYSSYTYFYKQKEFINIFTYDNESIKSREYLLSDTAFESQDKVTGNWIAISEDIQLTLEMNTKQFIYIRVTDNSGNTAIYNSEGIVIYSESDIPSEIKIFNNDIPEDILINAVLNGNTIKSIKNNGVLIENTEYTVNGDMIAFGKNYLVKAFESPETLSINLSFEFNPMGIETDLCSLQTKTLTVNRHIHTFVADDGDCSTPVICTDCGYIMVAAKTHNWDTVWSSDKINHWKICKNEGCNKIYECAEHIPGDAPTSKIPQVCTICGYELAPKLIFSDKTFTDEECRVTVKNQFTGNAKLSITPLSESESYYAIVSGINTQKNDIISAYDIALKEGEYNGKLTVIFEIGENYNGKTVSVVQNNNGTIETFDAVCENGIIKAELDSLSPVILTVQNNIYALIISCAAISVSALISVLTFINLGKLKKTYN